MRGALPPTSAKPVPGSSGTRRLLTTALLSIALGTSPVLASAWEWTVQSAASAIEFRYTTDGSPRTGLFAKFEGSGSFDPEDPSSADLLLKIDTSSIDLFDDLASGFAQSAEWFDSKNHPYVIYRLVSLTPIEGDRYRARGLLTIRGERRPVTSEIELIIGDELAAATGALEIVRGDYLLGVGPSAIFVDIGPRVVVSFDLQAARVR